MKIVKYVINESGIPILFEKSIVHCEIVSRVISAGFVIIDYDTLTDQFVVKCYGGSESLKVYSDQNDYLIIRDYLNNLFCNSDYEDSLRRSEFNRLSSIKSS